MEITKQDKTALLFGASGLVGGHCLNFLLSSPVYTKVIIFVRKELEIEDAKLVQEVVNFDELSTCKELIKGDDLFCCLGTTMKKAGSEEAFKRVDYTYIHEVAEIAVSNKVNQFLLVSSVGADKDSLFFYNQVKGELEDEIKLMPFWATYIFQPSLLLGERNENRWGESIAQKMGKLINSFTDGLLDKYQPVEADVVAKAMVMAAQNLKKGIHIIPSHKLQKLSRIENNKISTRS